MVITIDEYKEKVGASFDLTSLDTYNIVSAQEIVENYLGYKVEEVDYSYSKNICSNFVDLKAPITSIQSITLNAIPVVDYEISKNQIVFPRIVNGLLSISYKGGLNPLPASVKIAVLNIAIKNKGQNASSINTNGLNIPNGVSTTYQVFEATSLYRYLYPLAEYRIHRI